MALYTLTSARFLTVLFTLLVGLCPLAAQAQALTRDSALTLLKKDLTFDVCALINVEIRQLTALGIQQVVPDWGIAGFSAGATIKLLENAGYIVRAGGQFRPTDKLKPYVVGNVSGMGENYYKIRLMTIAPEEVTGISKVGDSAARVEYRLSRQVTDVARLIAPKAESAELRKPSEALFRKYDDGWRHIKQ